MQGENPSVQRGDSHGGVAAGLHDARLLLPGGVHHHPQEDGGPQQASGEEQEGEQLQDKFKRGKVISKVIKFWVLNSTDCPKIKVVGIN